MDFDLNKSIEILEKTPAILETYLNSLSDDWIKSNEGGDTWSPYNIVGHLIYGEKTDWLVRAKIILGQLENKTFEPFDRFAQFETDQNIPISDLINEFKILRSRNLDELKSMNITSEDLKLKGIHPEFGEVTLKELLSTWVVHDLGHIYQISRVMAHQYNTNVGPWKAYLRIINENI